MKIIRWVLVALLVSSPVMAADFRLETTKSSPPFYQSPVPMAVYQQTHKSDLSDLTIKNAVGEQVPYALVPYTQLHPDTSNRIETIPLQFSPVKIGALQNPGELRLELEKTAGSTSLNITSSGAKPVASTAYLIELNTNNLGTKFPPIKELLVEWQGGENTLNNVKVLSSADLKNWSFAGDATLLSTTSTSAITQHYIKLDNNWNIAGDARYLQIRPADDNDTGTIAITTVQARYVVLQTIADEPIWQEPRFLARETVEKTGKINIDFESFGHYPAGRYTIKLPQANTVTKVTVLVRNATNEAWREVSNDSIRSLVDGKPQPAYAIQAVDARFWRLQFDQSSGGIGAENPTLSLGWLPPTVVWNARGQAPFTLTVGDKPSIVNTISISNMLPDYTTQKLNNLPAASVIISNQALQDTPSAQDTATLPASTWVSPPDYKSWLLWGGLVLGVLLLAGMAYSLIKTERKD